VNGTLNIIFGDPVDGSDRGQTRYILTESTGKTWNLDFGASGGEALAPAALVETLSRRLARMMGQKSMPFDVKRMVYGGFKFVVDA